MRRYVTSRLTIIALVLVVVALISGVTWAANSPGPSAQLESSVVEIQAFPLTVEVGGVIKVAGAGFKPNEVVLFEVVTGEGPPIALKGGVANAAGAFLADATGATVTGGLPASIVPGIYTIQALTTRGHVASAPLVVTAKAK
jgi:hypothetical protein